MATISKRALEADYFEAYAGFARTLRLWFIAYGIGGPAAFLTNEPAGKKRADSGQGLAVAYAFLAAVALQILLAVTYKTAMWFLYVGETDKSLKEWKLYKGLYWITEQYWIEALGDPVTLALFGGATLRLGRSVFWLMRDERRNVSLLL